MSLREIVWAAAPEAMAIGMDAPHRATARYGSIICTDLGVPHSWGLTARLGLSEADPVDAGAALQWLRGRETGRGWRVAVPESHIGDDAWTGLSIVDRIPVFATTSETALRIELAVPGEMTLDDDPSFDDVIAGYGGWMSDRPLAELLVVPSDLQREDRRFIVGRVDGRVIGCAFVWYAANTGYLSGIGVVPELRGRGYGRALTAAAARMAAHNRDGSPTDAAWMYATNEGAALYGRMGFERIDTEVSLSDAPR